VATIGLGFHLKSAMGNAMKNEKKERNKALIFEFIQTDKFKIGAFSF
jgi:hypothetical protein